MSFTSSIKAEVQEACRALHARVEAAEERADALEQRVEELEQRLHGPGAADPEARSTARARRGTAAPADAASASGSLQQ